MLAPGLAVVGVALAACADPATAPPRPPVAITLRPADGPARALGPSVGGVPTGVPYYDAFGTGNLYNAEVLQSGPAPVTSATAVAVPAGETWTVGQVALQGYFAGGATTLHVRLLADDGAGHPGAVVADFPALAPAGADAVDRLTRNYLFNLPTVVALPGGAPGAGPTLYWLAVTNWTVAPGAAANARIFGFFHGPSEGAPGGGTQSAAGEPPTGWQQGYIDDFGPSRRFVFALFAPPALPQAITFDAVTPNPARLGASVPLVATAPGGTVTFAAGPATVCVASGARLAFIAVGTCRVTADQAGGAGYAPAPQASQDVAVEYAFTGFQAPVDNGGVLNRAKAGQAVPLKWRLTDAQGAPVTTLSAAAVTVAGLACGATTSGDALEAYAAGASGLQNLGNGYYQLNWKSPATYAGTCRTLRLDLGEGSGPRTALFQFTK